MNLNKLFLVLINFVAFSYSMDLSIKYSDHALERMHQRKVDKNQVESAINWGEIKKSKVMGHVIYCSTKKGKLRVVVSVQDNKVVTVYYKKQDDMLSAKEREKKQLKLAREERIKLIEQKTGVKYLEPSKVKDFKGLLGKDLDIAKREARSSKFKYALLEDSE